MVKISTFHHQPLQHVQYMGDGTVLLKFYDQWGRQPRHIRVSLEEWLAGFRASEPTNCMLPEAESITGSTNLLTPRTNVAKSSQQSN